MELFNRNNKKSTNELKRNLKSYVTVIKNRKEKKLVADLDVLLEFLAKEGTEKKTVGSLKAVKTGNCKCF